MLNKENKSDAGQQHSFTSLNLRKKGSITISRNSYGAQDGCNSDTVTLMTMIMNHAMMTIMATTVMITRRRTVIMATMMIQYNSNGNSDDDDDDNDDDNDDDDDDDDGDHDGREKEKEE